MTNEQLRVALALLASQQKKLLAKPKRDAWDKLSVFAPLITGLVITIASLYISNQFQVAQKTAAEQKEAIQKKADERDKQFQQKLARTELLNKFIPYLCGEQEEQSMAIVAISITGDADLLAAIGQMTPSKGVQDGLAIIATKGQTPEVRKRAAATLNLLESLERAPAGSKSDTLGARALDFALGELKRGVTEDPPGSNRGTRIDLYSKAAGIEPGYPWSGSFVCWCYKEAIKEGGALPIKLSPSFLSIQGELMKARRWNPQGSGYIPKPGDLAIFQFNHQIGHGGIVVAVDGEFVYTIEGNTGADENTRLGDSVGGKKTLRTLVEGFGDMSFE